MANASPMGRRFFLRGLTTALLAMSLAACSTGEDETGNNGGGGPPSPPSLTITASPTSVQSGGMSTLSWSVTGATSCTASDAWSGPKSTNGGSEDVGPLTTTSSFMLSCIGAGGSASDSVTVQVTAPGAPSVSLSASESTVMQGQRVTLSWTSTNVTSCNATGDWSGVKLTSGNESVGPLSADSTFNLECDGPGGPASDSAMVTVTTPTGVGAQGQVDSSLIDRWGENRVYVYSGQVTPDDFDGDAGDPSYSAAVRQDENACTFAYLQDLPNGTYTLAFTSEAADDDPTQDDPIELIGSNVITVANDRQISPFGPGNVIRVGPGRQFTTLNAVAGIAQDGDVIEVDAGVYPGDVASWFQSNLTIRGVGGFAHLRADGAEVQGKGTWVLAGANTLVENIEFSGSTVPDENGAGIRQEGPGLTICNGYFHDNENGILGGAGDIIIEYSEFANNGFGDGFSHNMYIVNTNRFVLRHSYSHHARIGHNVKTRADENYILYNRIMDEADGTSSYAVDIPNGGLSVLIGNLLQQGPNTDNFAIVNYGTEGLSGGRTHELYMANNTVVNDRGSGVFVQFAGGTSLVRAVNNIFAGGGSTPSGANVELVTNLETPSAGLVDVGAYDYRLTASSAAIDAGSDPGVARGISLMPAYQYVHPLGREARPIDGPIDIGAYEYVP